MICLTVQPITLEIWRERKHNAKIFKNLNFLWLFKITQHNLSKLFLIIFHVIQYQNLNLKPSLGNEFLSKSTAINCPTLCILCTDSAREKVRSRNILYSFFLVFLLVWILVWSCIDSILCHAFMTSWLCPFPESCANAQITTLLMEDQTPLHHKWLEG